MIERIIIIFITVIIDYLCICMTYHLNSKFAREELNIPISLGIISALVFMSVGIIMSFIAIYGY